jgi:hypothetical protein
MTAQFTTHESETIMVHNPVSIGDNGENMTETGNGVLLQYFIDHLNDLQIRADKANKEHRYHLRQLMAKSQPSFLPVTKSGTIPSSGNLILDFDGPMLGRRWVVRMVTISDSLSFWASMGSAEATLCSGISMNTIVPSQVRWPFNSLPNSATFGSDQMWIVPRDHVLLSITGGTSGQNVTSTLWLQDFPELNAGVAVNE